MKLKTPKLALGLLALLGLTCRVSSAAEPIRNNNYNIDMVGGPILASGRVMSLGGAYTALAHGVDGAAWNPASYATRSLWEPNWFEWDASAGIQLPGLFSQNDYFNNRQGEGIGVEDFLFWNTGLRLQFARLGTGGLFRFNSFSVPTDDNDTVAVNTYLGQFGGAWMWLDGQLITGAALRLAGMGLTHEDSSELFSLNGIGLELGALWKPAKYPVRIGIAGRTPVRSERLTKNAPIEAVEQQEGYILPTYAHLPYEIQIGFAFQLGKRPMNRKWQIPLDPKIRLVRDLKHRWCEREFKQAQLEYEHLQKEIPTESKCPIRRYKARDHDWWDKEKLRRADERIKLNEAIDERRDTLRADLRADYLSLPRFHWLFSVDFMVFGPSPNAVGLDAFIDQELRRSGEKPSFAVRLGTEVEPWLNRLKLRLGSYLEPSRKANVKPRMHGTAGFDFRLFTWDFFGLVEPLSVRLGANIDVTVNYFNWGVGIGMWH